MTPEQSVSLRDRLQKALGHERFAKFVDDSNVGQRRWWQEKAWEAFTAANPEYNCSQEELSQVLRICSLHGTPLQQDQVPLIQGIVDWTEPYRAAKSSKFRYAHSGPIYTQGTPQSESTKSVWYCADCREIEQAWLTKNGRTTIPLDWLRYRIDFEKMDAAESQLHSELGFSNHSRVDVARAAPDRWLEKRRTFLSAVLPGDEVWAFKSPPETWASLSGRAGFAVVRAGICVATLVMALN